MVYRLSPENVRPPRGGPSGALALAVVLALVVGIWFVAGGDPGSRMGGGDPGPTPLPTEGPPTVDPVSGLPYIGPAQLPEEGLALFVRATGDTPPRGTAFDDTAGQLPPQEAGYYTTYAVPPGTPADPGAERIVVGLGSEAYWTDDGGTTYARIGP